MSGVSVGTRLEKLERLRRHAKQDLELARRDGDVLEIPRLVDLLARIDEAIAEENRPPPAPPRTVPTLPMSHPEIAGCLAMYGVTANQVKTWAVEQGLIPAVARGRVGGPLVAAYAAAHVDEGSTP